MPVRFPFCSPASIHPEASAAVPSSSVLLPVFSPQASAPSLAAFAPAQASPPQQELWAWPEQPPRALTLQEEVSAAPGARPAQQFAGAQSAQAESGSAQAEWFPAGSIPDDCWAAPAPDDYSADSLPDARSVVPAPGDSAERQVHDSVETARPPLAVRLELAQCRADS